MISVTQEIRMKHRSVWLLFAILIMTQLSCGRGTPTVKENQPPASLDETSLPVVPPTVTAFPIPPPPANVPSALPANAELQALIQYANEMRPLLIQAGELLQEDGAILQAAEDGNDDVLCDGRLAADNTTMKDVLRSVQSINPPEEAQIIHNLVLESGNAWTEALDNIENFCVTGNQLYKIPAVVKFWEAGTKLQDAGNRFWLLMVAKGVEDWVQR
jgi:hypothetical protein